MVNLVGFSGQFKIYGKQNDVKKAADKIEAKGNAYFIKTHDSTRVIDYIEGLVVTEDENTPAYSAKEVLKDSFEINAK